MADVSPHAVQSAGHRFYQVQPTWVRLALPSRVSPLVSVRKAHQVIDGLTDTLFTESVEYSVYWIVNGSVHTSVVLPKMSGEKFAPIASVRCWGGWPLPACRHPTSAMRQRGIRSPLRAPPDPALELKWAWRSADRLSRLAGGIVDEQE
jgi:hypothetical protein